MSFDGPDETIELDSKDFPNFNKIIEMPLGDPIGKIHMVDGQLKFESFLPIENLTIYLPSRKTEDND